MEKRASARENTTRSVPEGEPIDGATDRTPQTITAAMVQAVLRNGSFALALQPISDLRSGQLVAYEALSRFPGGYPPNVWFDAANGFGLGLQLELAAVAKALALIEVLPAKLSISVNVSPATLASGALATAIRPHPHERVIVEIAEHAGVRDSDALAEHAQLLQFRGVRIALDDYGVGSSKIQDILRLRPDMIKLDKSITTGIATEPVKRSLVGCIAKFGMETRTDIVAEGIETQADYDMLLGLGIGLGQGWLIGRPVEPAVALAQGCLMRQAGLL